MAIVAGVDFGTLSVRVSLVDSERGLLDSAVAEYPLHRKREDPEYATQSHDDHMRALAAATREALKKTGIARRSGAGHRARHHRLVGDPRRQKSCSRSANIICGAITAPKAKRPRSPKRLTARSLEAIQWCGGVYSSEWGFSKLLHWLRHNPDKRSTSLPPPLSIATWWRPRSAASPIREK